MKQLLATLAIFILLFAFTATAAKCAHEQVTREDFEL